MTKPTIEDIWSAPTKCCTRCKDEYPRARFSVVNTRGRYYSDSWCKGCRKAYKARSYQEHVAERRAYASAYAVRHKTKISLRRKRRRKECPDLIRAADARKRARYRERTRAGDRRRYQLNKERDRARRNEADRKERMVNPQAAIKHRLRHRIWMAVRDAGARKHANTMTLVGCSIEQLMLHLEAGFTSGMSWSNRGKWHIDHIRPCASFDLTDPEEQRKCFHWSNLQPLWAADNIRKRDSYENITS